MPYAITTPEHGTAFDIAGKGIAKTKATEEAIRIAAGCGVALLATAHAQSVAALRHRALYRALLDEHIFRRAVCITRSDGERVYTVEDLT